MSRLIPITPVPAREMHDLLPDDAMESIFVRLPPDDPSFLFRSSLVCQDWRRILSKSGFRRRLREHHGAPPLLGCFVNSTTRFVPTTAGSALSLPVPQNLSFLDCRHGRALLVSFGGRYAHPKELVIWEPITGYQQRVPLPVPLNCITAAAVVCAADCCDHCDCDGKPFRVVLLRSTNDADSVLSVWKYLSETGAWGEPIQINLRPFSYIEGGSSILVEKSLYFLSNNRQIIEFDLDGQGLAVIDSVIDPPGYYFGGTCLLQTEEGGLGVAKLNESCLHLWTRQTSGNAGWVLTSSINLESRLPAVALRGGPRVVCFAEGVNVIFLKANLDIFAVDLNSCQVRKVWRENIFTLFPFVSFYTPGTS